MLAGTILFGLGFLRLGVLTNLMSYAGDFWGVKVPYKSLQARRAHTARGGGRRAAGGCACALSLAPPSRPQWWPATCRGAAPGRAALTKPPFSLRFEFVLQWWPATWRAPRCSSSSHKSSSSWRACCGRAAPSRLPPLRCARPPALAALPPPSRCRRSHPAVAPAPPAPCPPCLHRASTLSTPPRRRPSSRSSWTTPPASTGQFLLPFFAF